MAGKRRSATKSAAKATSKATSKAAAKSAKSARADARTARAGRGSLTHEDVMQASIRPDPELRRRSELLWEDRTPATRGPKAALTPDDVVRAAVDLADADGLSAVTMHAVAARVGFTTMAVYRYFPSKDALLDAVIDAGTGLPPQWSVPRADWRTEISRWAHAKRALLCARPWLAELPFVAAPHGPNWLAWLESIADSLSRTGLRGTDIGQMLSIVDGYTRGASDTAVSLARAGARDHRGRVGRRGRRRPRAGDRRSALPRLRGAHHHTGDEPRPHPGGVVRLRVAARARRHRAVHRGRDRPVARRCRVRRALARSPRAR